MPKILVAYEEHATRYLRASTVDELHASALKLLTERKVAGYWYSEPEEPKYRPTMTLEQAKALPEGPVRAAAMAEHTTVQRQREQYEADLKDYKKIVEAVEKKDGKAAWQCLRNHRDYEYESVTLEELE